MHPFISTDFSESQLELIAPPFQSEKKLLEFMQFLHRYIYRRLEDEVLWSMSAPPVLEGDIPIARYGSSFFAYEKELYRKGLHHRYGSEMQALSGMHYNFSLPEPFFTYLGDKSEVYLHVVRNYLRFGWLITYLFGASPVYDETFFTGKPQNLELLAPHTIGGRYATSLRMSEYGYYSKIQTQVGISFNSLSEHIRDLEYAVSTSSEAWKDIASGDQMNDHIIQIEAEHYSRIRPKSPPTFRVRPIEALKQQGIGYLEVRGLDLDPWSIEGLDLEQLTFLHTFLIYCLTKESPPLSHKEEQNLTYNQNLVALKGREPHLVLNFNGNGKTLTSWATQLIDQIQPVAEILDSVFDTDRYSKTLQRQQEKVNHPEKTPSERLLSQVLQSSYRELGLELAFKFREDFLQQECPTSFEEELDTLALKSIEEQESLEIYDNFILKGYEDLELSTQALIREAWKRGIEVEELDRKAHFFRFRRGDHTEYVKNATMTSRDSLITYLQMENKEVTKKLLSEQGISVPLGILCYDEAEAMAAYPRLSDRKLIVKPNRMNYGIGIYMIEKDDRPNFKVAVNKAFDHEQEVVIETFLEGQEYRFLVIDGKTVAICERVPANVVGDGHHTIRELIRLKNNNPHMYKIPKYYLHAGEEEAAVLDRQGMTFDTIPAERQQVFIRENSNVSTGGDSIDRTDELHPGYAEIAIKSAEIVQATFCGVDMIIRKPQAAPNPGNYGIIELNFNPALWIHRYPTFGTQRTVEKDVLDALGFPEV